MTEICEKNEDLKGSVVAQVALRGFLHPESPLPDHELFKADTQRVLMESIADKLGKVPFSQMENDYLGTNLGDGMVIPIHLIEVLKKYGHVDGNPYIKKLNDLGSDYYAPNFQTIRDRQPGGPEEMGHMSEIQQLLNTPITDIRFNNPSSKDSAKDRFSENACKVLTTNKILTLLNLVQKKDLPSLLSLRGFGKKTLDEIEALLDEYKNKLSLGMDLSSFEVLEHTAVAEISSPVVGESESEEAIVRRELLNRDLQSFIGTKFNSVYLGKGEQRFSESLCLLLSNNGIKKLKDLMSRLLDGSVKSEGLGQVKATNCNSFIESIGLKVGMNIDHYIKTGEVKVE